MSSDAGTAPQSAVGRATLRVDGPLKVSGAARIPAYFH
jgi:hypothetical protein